MDCLRCSRALTRLDSPDELVFWRCPHCARDYTEREGRLTDRWLSPLSIVLYGIIYSEDPEADAERAASQLAATNPPAYVALLVSEIEDELARPKQRVRDIHALVHDVSEQQVRAFLAKVAARLRGA